MPTSEVALAIVERRLALRRPLQWRPTRTRTRKDAALVAAFDTSRATHANLAAGPSWPRTFSFCASMTKHGIGHCSHQAACCGGHRL
eukprot:scaffold15928_cov86-Isochrysis_galbana.AAC.1